MKVFKVVGLSRCCFFKGALGCFGIDGFQSSFEDL